jgi:hypothetical protein
MQEQSPAPWPKNGYAYAQRTVSDSLARYASGYPTECDGDLIAWQRGDLIRAVRIVTHI